MSTGAKGDSLTWVVQVGPTLEILLFEPRYIDQHFLWRRLAGKRRDCHRPVLLMAQDRAWRSRSLRHIGRLYGRSRICPSPLHSVLPCASIRVGWHTTRSAGGRPQDKI